MLGEGARVLVTGHSDKGAETAALALAGGAVVLKSDVTSMEDLEALTTRAKAEFGQIDALFVNAGTTLVKSFKDTTEQAYDDLMSLNLKGAYFSVQKLAPLLVNDGAVVLTTSVGNVLGLPNITVYSASKAALRSLARTLARELLDRGIRVNALSPGPISTPILDKVLGEKGAEQARAGFLQSNPMKREGRPDEVAKAFAFLAFEATYTTGAELVVDGGQSQLG
jgi:NAD(P)-dependent dehydrogenase (short-subunit alcohol dehydrogenase family)